MNWNKLKTFLIVLFSALNIILIITMFTKDYRETVVPQETIQDTVEVLEKRGIKIDKSIIPDRAKNMEGFSMQTLEFENFAEKIKFYGDNTFEFSVEEKVSSAKDIKRILENRGIMYAEFVGDTKDLSKIKAIEVIDGFRIFGSYLDINTQGNKVNIKGAWLTPSSQPYETEGESEPSQVTSILMEFISNPDRLRENITIEKIEFGYYSPEYTLTNKVQVFTVVPCWQISLDSGENFYYDARNGEYLR